MSAVFAPLQDAGRAESVVRRIAEAVTIGLMGEGEQLPSENDLALQFGVANGTVREALAILREQGLVQTRRGRNGGSFIRTPSEGLSRIHQARLRDIGIVDLRDLGDEQFAVSGAAARFAAERAPSDVRERLGALVTALREAKTPAERRKADTRFHIEVAVASQSVRLTRREVALQAELGPLTWLPGEWAPDPGRVADEHHGILVAVVAGDAAAARGLAEEHAIAGAHHLVRNHLRLTSP
ncbi:FadR/GntR family transcriptional regulator [Streptomyces uncialis]|uniref:FadR/GntR family transcriptional regulator n=1 Tax=Streptomyces uncialis TaxID=1048205 RepID=UPI00386FC63E|nr:FCD domain-containing protein [Streptomyces uncialis]